MLLVTNERDEQGRSGATRRPAAMTGNGGERRRFNRGRHGHSEKGGALGTGLCRLRGIGRPGWLAEHLQWGLRKRSWERSAVFGVGGGADAASSAATRPAQGGAGQESLAHQFEGERGYAPQCYVPKFWARNRIEPAGSMSCGRGCATMRAASLASSPKLTSMAPTINSG